MRLLRRPDGSVRVRHDAAFVRGILFALSGAVAAAAWLREPWDALASGLGLLAALLPFTGALLYEGCEFDFDAATRRLRWRRRNLLRTLAGEIAFEDVLEVQVLTSSERDSDRPLAAPQRVHRLVLATRGGALHLANRTLRDERQVQQIAAAIRGALGIPAVAPSAQQEVARLVAAGQTVDAVTLLRGQLGIGLAEARERVEALREGAPDATPRRGRAARSGSPGSQGSCSA